MQIPLIEGRFFNDGDTADSPPVVVVDQYLANSRFFQPQRARSADQRGGPTVRRFTIVGVVGTINSIDLGQPVTKERVYRPATQQPPAGDGAGRQDRPRSADARRRRWRRGPRDRSRAADRRRADDGPVDVAVAGARRTPMMLLALFGSVALVLSAIGIYGVLAFSVAQRGREFGIRQALGADQRSSLVLKQGLITAGIGIVLGLVGRLRLQRCCRRCCSASTRDVPVFAGVTLAASPSPSPRATSRAARPRRSNGGAATLTLAHRPSGRTENARDRTTII